jgi:hypothetical protein
MDLCAKTYGAQPLKDDRDDTSDPAKWIGKPIQPSGP